MNTAGGKLTQLVKLSQRKQALLAEIQEIDSSMRRLEREFGETSGETVRKGRLTVSVAGKKKSGGRRRLSRKEKTPRPRAPHGIS